MIREIQTIIEDKKRFLITTHIDPDGDAIGSSFAMHFFLELKDRYSDVYLEDAIPYRYQFLPGPKKIEREIRPNNYDAIFVIDCGDLKRVGKKHDLLKEHPLLVNIDHHDTNEMFGTINCVDVNASSTAEILFRIFKSFGYQLNYEIAINLYTAILTDTGSFRFQNTNEAAFHICGEMVRLGVSPRFVAEMVYENHPKERFLLLCEVLRTLQITDDGKVGIVVLTNEMYKKTNSNYEHSDGLVEYLREIRGIKVAVLIRELGDGKCKVSMRSKDETDVSIICRRLGGGGHKNAAGCVIAGEPEEVREIIKKAIAQK